MPARFEIRRLFVGSAAAACVLATGLTVAAHFALLTVPSAALEPADPLLGPGALLVAGSTDDEGSGNDVADLGVTVDPKSNVFQDPVVAPGPDRNSESHPDEGTSGLHRTREPFVSSGAERGATPDAVTADPHPLGFGPNGGSGAAVDPSSPGSVQAAQLGSGAFGAEAFGVTALTTTSRMIAIPRLVRGPTGDTHLLVQSTQPYPATLGITVRDERGAQVASQERRVPPLGRLELRAEELVPPTFAGSALILSNVEVAVAVEEDGPGTSITYEAPGRPSTRLGFPLSGTTGTNRTLLALQNVTDRPASINLTYIPGVGPTVGTPIAGTPVELPPFAGRTLDLATVASCPPASVAPSWRTQRRSRLPGLRSWAAALRHRARTPLLPTEQRSCCWLLLARAPR